MSQAPDRRAEDLHRSSVVVDCLYPIHPQADLIPRIRAGGVNVIHVTVGSSHHETFRAAVERIHMWLEFIDHHPGDLLLARSVGDVHQAFGDGRIAVVMGFQNSSLVEDDLRLIRVVKELGTRIIQVTYNERNLFGDGCTERQNSGLSDLGLAFVAEMNRLGMLIDLSHAGEVTALETIEASNAPVIVSHACIKAIHQNARNLSDEVIRALTAKGGTIGISMFPGFVSAKPGSEQTVDDFIAHIDYVAQLAGIDHVGIGTDLPDGKTGADFETPDGKLGKGSYIWKSDSYPPWPWHYAIPSVDAFPRITQGLVARGYTDDDVAKVLGRNFLRVFAEVWGA